MYMTPVIMEKVTMPPRKETFDRLGRRRDLEKAFTLKSQRSAGMNQAVFEPLCFRIGFEVQGSSSSRF